MVRWGIKWRQRTENGGWKTHIMGGPTGPICFLKKRDALAYIRSEYAYLRTRKDLRRAPHWWRMPHAVRIRIDFEEVPHD